MSGESFGDAVAAARATLRDNMGNGTPRAVRDLLWVIEGTVSGDNAKQAVATAWALLRYDHLAALDRYREEEDDDELDTLPPPNNLLWEAVHEASGAVVEGDPKGIKYAMDSLERWWLRTR